LSENDPLKTNNETHPVIVAGFAIGSPGAPQSFCISDQLKITWVITAMVIAKNIKLPFHLSMERS